LASCSKNALTVVVFRLAASKPAVLPVAGHTAASTYRHAYFVCRTARGRDPRRAHTRVSVPC
jgi:hypothetical protein